MVPVTLVVAPDQEPCDGRPARKDPPAVLASHLGAALGQTVPIFFGELQAAPADSLLIGTEWFHAEHVSSYAPAQRLQVGRRTVLLHARWASVHTLLEQNQLAAAVDERDYWDFCTHPGLQQGARMYGRIAAAERAGISYETEPRFRPDSYALLSARGDGISLPDLLARYLTAYAALGLPLSR